MSIVAFRERDMNQSYLPDSSLPSMPTSSCKIITFPGQLRCIWPTDLLECKEPPVHFSIWTDNEEPQPSNNGQDDSLHLDGMAYSDAALDISYCPYRKQRRTPTGCKEYYCHNRKRIQGGGCPNTEEIRATGLFKTRQDE